MGESTAKGTRGLLSAALSAEPPVQEFSPSDPEYYLEDDEGANAVFVDAARVLVWLGSGALRQVVLCVTRAPSDRLITLQLVLGELKRHGRVPQDVGGLRGALTMLRQVYRKEGLMSLLRAAYVDAMFLLPVSIANALAQFTAEVLLSRVFPKVLLRGSTLESSHTQVMLHSLMQFACDVVVIILRSPVYEMRDSIVVNYRADIVAPVRDVGAMENPAEFACASSTLSPMSAQQDDEAYLFCSAREFFSTAINRHGLWAFYRGLPFELAKAASYRANELALRMAMPYMLYLPRLGIAPCALLWLLAVTQPFDVMKRRALLTASFGMAYPGPVAFVRRIVSLEGYRYLGFVHLPRAHRIMAYPQQSMYDVGPTPGEFLTDMALQASLNFLQRAVLAPTYRMTVLTAVEGELKRQKRLGNEGFGGIWGIARRVYGKEGKLAFFRGLLTDAVLSVPSAITEELSTSLVSSIAFSVFTEERIQSLPSVVVITISLLSTSFAVLLASPVSGIQSTISTNYIADIVAPQPKAAPESAAGRAGAASGPEGCAAALSDAVEDTTEQSETVCPSQEGNKETETYHYANSRETARDIKQRNGWRGFYRGVGLDAVAVFVYRGTYYYTLRALPEWFQEAYPYGIARTLALAAGVITQPLEVISRRMMLTASAPGDSGYRNMIDCARTIISEEGYSGLWSGLKMRLLITGVGIVAMELRNIF